MTELTAKQRAFCNQILRMAENYYRAYGTRPTAIELSSQSLANHECTGLAQIGRLNVIVNDSVGGGHAFLTPHERR